ncbi:anaerobic sulfatase maturase [Aeromonas sp. BIGb0445]|uniref:anaerobic sulfatase maturase n=1 Tax=Aeromonas sp. BIGb0445 TaxID=2940593 RepID=UPI0021682552|nr:anaerobic sulfatase maturase [Aeromonas sp. BIGb0445]MCS3458481.1 uncharacterized protein [Aeromonas sp. BIGb0445]
MLSLHLPHSHLPPLPKGQHYRFHTMVKPGGSRCNIDCDYCFYLHKGDLFQHDAAPRLSDELLEQHIRQYIEAQTGDEVVFSWQGGEPTLLGLPFFEKVVALQAKYRKAGQRIENDLQTNGILLNEAWVAFLKRHGFLVGLSIDGPRDLHDIHRKNRAGRPTFDGVMTAVELLRGAEVPFAALCVVNRNNAKQGERVYRFLAEELGCTRIQFTPVVEPRIFRQGSVTTLATEALPWQGSPEAEPGHPMSIVTDWSVAAADYGQFLCDVWDVWLAEGVGRVHVNLFETAVAQSAGMPAQMCTQAPFCGKALALEHDGEVYSCDHFVYPEHRIGNIAEQHLGDLAFGNQQIAFGQAKHLTLPDQCRRCDYLALCWGGCPKDRLLRTQEGQRGLNYLCGGFMQFYRHIDSDMVPLLRRLGLF